MTITRLLSAAALLAIMVTMRSAPAHAQRAANPTPSDLVARVAGARITLHGRPIRGNGSTLFTYDVSYPAAPDLWAAYIIDLTPTHAAALAANGALFQIARRPSLGGPVQSVHQTGAWVVEEDGHTLCRLAGGSTSRRVAFVIATFGPAGQCALLQARMAALARAIVAPLILAQV